MATATKPVTTTHADRLLARFRTELEYMVAHELVEALLALPAMSSTTVARLGARLSRARSETTAAKLGEAAIREMVARGHAAQVEAWIERETAERIEAQVKHERSRLRAGLDRLMRGRNALADLEAVEHLVNRLAAGAA